MLRTLLMTSVALPALAVSSAAWSQDQDDDSADAIDEIIVTTRKREENLQDVPLAISAFTSEALEDAGIEDVTDLALQTPGFSFREGFGRATGAANNRPSIRGMSSILGTGNAAFLVDGVYVAGPIAAYDMENLERVEVVRGPQSAMFGRGAFAGAVNFVSRRPGQDTRGKINMQLGKFDTRAVSGYYSFPLSEKMAMEVNGRFYQFGGDYVNQLNGKRELGEERSWRVGTKLNFTPSETFSMFINLNYAEDEDGNFAYGHWNGGDYRPDGVSANKVNCYEPVVDNPFYFFGVYPLNATLSRGYYCGEIGTPSAFYADTDGDPGLERETFTSSMEMSADFDNGMNLTAITGYTWFKYYNNFGSYYPGAIASLSGQSNEYFSQELRLSGPADDRVRWMVGGYYFKDSDGNGFTNPGGYDPLVENGFDDITDTTSESYIKNVAAFGSLDYDLSENVTLGAEIRYQEETLHLEGSNTVTGIDDLKFDAWLPRFTMTYEPNDDTTIYASVAKGNKPGAFNDAYYALTVDRDQADFWIGQGRGTVKESTMWSYEVGMKGRLSDMARYDLSVYYVDWKDQQLTASDAITTSTGSQTTVAYIVNAGESEVKGFEANLDWSPSDRMHVRFGYAYSDAEFTDYLDENWRDLQDTNGWTTGSAHLSKIAAGMPAGVTMVAGSEFDSDGDGVNDQALVVDNADPDGQVAGNTLPQTPKHMFNVTSTYTIPMSDGMEGFIRWDFSHESKRYVQAANLAWMGSTNKVNMRAGITKGDVKLSFYVNNLTKEETPEVVTRLLDFDASPFFMPAQQRPLAPFPFGQFRESRFNFIRDFTVTAPRVRTFGVELSYNF